MIVTGYQSSDAHRLQRVAPNNLILAPARMRVSHANERPDSRPKAPSWAFPFSRPTGSPQAANRSERLRPNGHLLLCGSHRTHLVPSGGCPLMTRWTLVALLVAVPLLSAAPATVVIDTPMPAPRGRRSSASSLPRTSPPAASSTRSTTTRAATSSASCAGAPTTGRTMRSRTSTAGRSCTRSAQTTRSSRCI